MQHNGHDDRMRRSLGHIAARPLAMSCIATSVLCNSKCTRGTSTRAELRQLDMGMVSETADGETAMADLRQHGSPNIPLWCRAKTGCAGS